MPRHDTLVSLIITGLFPGKLKVTEGSLCAAEIRHRLTGPGKAMWVGIDIGTNGYRKAQFRALNRRRHAIVQDKLVRRPFLTLTPFNRCAPSTQWCLSFYQSRYQSGPKVLRTPSPFILLFRAMISTSSRDWTKGDLEAQSSAEFWRPPLQFIAYDPSTFRHGRLQPSQKKVQD